MATDNIPVMDRLTGQLYHLPGIIGNLGVSVANAQKTLNSDYLRNVLIILEMINKMLKDEDDANNTDNVATIKELLKQLAPSRYQFTETTLEFHADLAERKSTRLESALGAGFASVTISAAYARAFGYDYRAAARVRAVLHALPANESMLQPMLDQAKGVNLDAGDLPKKYEIEKEVFNNLAAITNALADFPAGKKVEPEPEQTPTDAG